MRLSNKYGGLQFFAVANPVYITVNGTKVMLEGDEPVTFAYNASANTTSYTIDSNNRVVWNDGKFLAYNDVIVFGSNSIVANGNYTTVEGGGEYNE